MRLITEEKLKEVFSKLYWSRNDEQELFNALALLAECKELNAWQPIETAPKDRNILVYDPGYGHLIVIWSEFYNLWITNFGRKLTEQPTHWQELPESPE